MVTFVSSCVFVCLCISPYNQLHQSEIGEAGTDATNFIVGPTFKLDLNRSQILLLAVKICSTRLVLFAESKDIGEAHALVQEFLPVITMTKIKVWHS